MSDTVPDDVKPISPCCFCGLEIASSDNDPTYLQMGTRSEVTKAWWCHFACFTKHLPDMPEPWTIYDRDSLGL